MTYKLHNEDLAAKVNQLDEDIRNDIIDCVQVWAWMAAASENSESQPPMEDTPEARALVDGLWKNVKWSIGMIPPGCRIISVAKLRRSFRSWLPAKIEKHLTSLEKLAVVSSNHFTSTKGRNSEIRYFNTDYLAIDNPVAFAKIESALVLALHAAVCAQPAPAVVIPNALRVLQDTFVSLNGSFFTVYAGTVVDNNFALQKWLVESGAPVVSLDDTEATQCPECRTRFTVTPESQKRDVPVLICLANLRFYIEGCMIVREKGQLEADERLGRFLVEGGFPVAVARADEYAVCINAACMFFAN